MGAVIGALAALVAGQGPEAALVSLARVKRWVDVAMDRQVARMQAAGVPDPDIEQSLAAQTKSTRRAAKNATKRSKLIDDNPELADQATNGDLGQEQLDAIANAAAETNTLDNVDDDLVDAVRQGTPDQARQRAKDWVDTQRGLDDVETAEQRRHRRRHVTRYRDHDRDMYGLRIEGDKASIDHMFQTLQAQAKQLYETDGGRDLAPTKHPRTREQRLYDALHTTITGTGTGTSRGGAGGRPTVVFVQRLHPTNGDRPRNADGRTGRGRRHSGRGRGRAGGGRAGPDDDADQPSPLAQPTLIGSGPIAPDTLATIIATADPDIAVIIESATGNPLWHGRAKRHATNHQRLALIVRDRGCVLCGAPHHHCETHHLMPWHAPAKGTTDIDQLALLCSGCHHHLHDTDHTLIRTSPTKPTRSTEPAATASTGPARPGWTTRPATPHETPPQRIIKH